MKVRQEFQGLSREQLLDRAYELGSDYERVSHGCSQCTVAALHALLPLEDVLVRAANSCHGGQASRVEGTCGGLIGGTIVLDSFFGRTTLSTIDGDEVDGEAFQSATAIAATLAERYAARYGAILCPLVQKRLFGRTFDFNDPEQHDLFERAGGHSDPSKCTDVVGSCARWTMELLLDTGALEHEPAAT